MNHLFRTEGIVLNSIKLNEADKIVTIFSNNYGKIRAIAKGVRKIRSKFGSSMENLTVVNLLLFKGRSINIISQSEIVISFFSQGKDVLRYGLAINCAEIIDKITVEEDPNRKLYNLFKKLLLLFKDEENPLLLVESFKWKIFSILGYQPELRRCINCHSPIVHNNEKHHIFDIAKGGISCIKCQKNTSFYKIKITDYQLKLLQRMQEADLEKIHNKYIDPAILLELGKITELYFSHHFEIENKSKHFLNSLKTTR